MAKKKNQKAKGKPQNPSIKIPSTPSSATRGTSATPHDKNSRSNMASPFLTPPTSPSTPPNDLPTIDAVVQQLLDMPDMQVPKQDASSLLPEPDTDTEQNGDHDQGNLDEEKIAEMSETEPKHVPDQTHEQMDQEEKVELPTVQEEQPQDQNHEIYGDTKEKDLPALPVVDSEQDPEQELPQQQSLDDDGSLPTGAAVEIRMDEHADTQTEIPVSTDTQVLGASEAQAAGQSSIDMQTNGVPPELEVQSETQTSLDMQAEATETKQAHTGSVAEADVHVSANVVAHSTETKVPIETLVEGEAEIEVPTGTEETAEELGAEVAIDADTDAGVQVEEDRKTEEAEVEVNVQVDEAEAEGEGEVEIRAEEVDAEISVEEAGVEAEAEVEGEREVEIGTQEAVGEGVLGIQVEEVEEDIGMEDAGTEVQTNVAVEIGMDESEAEAQVEVEAEVRMEGAEASPAVPAANIEETEATVEDKSTEAEVDTNADAQVQAEPKAEVETEEAEADTDTDADAKVEVAAETEIQAQAEIEALEPDAEETEEVMNVDVATEAEVQVEAIAESVEEAAEVQAEAEADADAEAETQTEIQAEDGEKAQALELDGEPEYIHGLDHSSSPQTMEQKQDKSDISMFSANDVASEDILAIANVLAIMKSALVSMSDAFQRLGNQTQKLGSLSLDIKAAEQLRHLQFALEEQIVRHKTEIKSLRISLKTKIKEAVEEKIQCRLFDMVKETIQERIEEKVRHQLYVQIPDDLRHQVISHKRQILQVQTNLHNSEARRYNSLQTVPGPNARLRPLLRPLPTPEQSPVILISRSSSLANSTLPTPTTAFRQVPAPTPIKRVSSSSLRPALLPETVPPTPSLLFPRDLTALFALSQDETRRLLREYGLDSAACSPARENARPRGLSIVNEESKDDNVDPDDDTDAHAKDMNKFMAHIGVPFLMIPAPKEKFDQSAPLSSRSRRKLLTPLIIK